MQDATFLILISGTPVLNSAMELPLCCSWWVRESLALLPMAASCYGRAGSFMQIDPLSAPGTNPWLCALFGVGDILEPPTVRKRQKDKCTT